MMLSEFERDQMALERQRMLLREAAGDRGDTSVRGAVWRERVAAALMGLALRIAPGTHAAQCDSRTGATDKPGDALQSCASGPGGGPPRRAWSAGKLG